MKYKVRRIQLMVIYSIESFESNYKKLTSVISKNYSYYTIILLNVS